MWKVPATLSAVVSGLARVESLYYRVFISRGLTAAVNTSWTNSHSSVNTLYLSRCSCKFCSSTICKKWMQTKTEKIRSKKSWMTTPARITDKDCQRLKNVQIYGWLQISCVNNQPRLAKWNCLPSLMDMKSDFSWRHSEELMNNWNINTTASGSNQSASLWN